MIFFAQVAALAAYIRPAAMIWIYRFLFLPALLVLAPVYLLRMRKRGGYGEHFGQRFGGHPRLAPRASKAPRLWLQAVSVGEMLAIGPIVEALHRDGAEIYLTTTTSTGFRLAKERYGAMTLGVGYFPLDWWPFVRRTWQRIDPDLVILTEGERWPELLWQASQRHVPVLSVNARLSDRSFHRMKTFRAFSHVMLRGITRVLPGSAHDARRFRELGLPEERMVITGNIKLDVHIPRLTDEDRARLRTELGLRPGLVLLGSSTWPGEEEALLNAWRAAQSAGLPCSLLLVPRHAERRAEIERLLEQAGVRFHFRSRGAATSAVDVAVADTTGELRRLTQLADLVFVGKSLPPHTEGQTPVEAAALEKAIVFGPGMSNFRPIAQDLLARGAAREAANADDLVAICVELLREPVARGRLAGAAKQWRCENAGAVERTLRVIRAEIAQVRE